MKKEKANPKTEPKNAVKPSDTKTETTEEGNEKANKTRKILNIVINVVLIVAIVIAVIATYVSFVSTSGNGVPNIFGLRLLSIQTDSMYPELKPGDLIFATGVDDPSTLRPKDIITYWTVINGERVLNTHRIVNIYDGGNHLIFETQGDNNTSVDPMTVHESEIVGLYKGRIPGLGKVFDYLQTSTGFLIVVVVPVFLFFLYHLVQFFRVLFEYQNVKNRIKFETERGRTEDIIAAHEAQKAAKEAERAALEAELREKLRAELLADMKKDAEKNTAASTEQPSAQAPEVSAEQAPAQAPEVSAEQKAEAAPAQGADTTAPEA